MIHGPGCPVCFAPLEKLDRATAIAERPEPSPASARCCGDPARRPLCCHCGRGAPPYDSLCPNSGCCAIPSEGRPRRRCSGRHR
ncbi:hypothetical protein [Streptomyces sp. GQFP]|uniref:hypothetical protein n=1 Tax=Streptomyces sp. GQFP TaxID=2907545 RepID=UPI003FA6DE46